jgi:hypothetical protein
MRFSKVKFHPDSIWTSLFKSHIYIGSIAGSDFYLQVGYTIHSGNGWTFPNIIQQVVKEQMRDKYYSHYLDRPNQDPIIQEAIKKAKMFMMLK